MPLPPPHRIDVLTLFPAVLDGYLSQSILSRAIAGGLVGIERWDIRDWATGKHKQVDDRPFGGGPGMVLMAPPVVAATEAVRRLPEPPGRLILLSPQGRRLDQARVQELALEPRLILLCGRYEGFDERIIEILEPELLSVGDFILSGGEVAAMVLIDAIVRLIPGVLGDSQSAVDESFGPDGGLEYPQYTRPRDFRGRNSPRDPLERRPRRDRPLATRTPPMNDLHDLILQNRGPANFPSAGCSKGTSHAKPTHGAGREDHIETHDAQVRDRRHGRRPRAHPRGRQGADPDLQRRGDRPVRPGASRDVRGAAHRAR